MITSHHKEGVPVTSSLSLSGSIRPGVPFGGTLAAEDVEELKTAALSYVVFFFFLIVVVVAGRLSSFVWMCSYDFQKEELLSNIRATVVDEGNQKELVLYPKENVSVQIIKRTVRTQDSPIVPAPSPRGGVTTPRGNQNVRVSQYLNHLVQTSMLKQPCFVLFFVFVFCFSRILIGFGGWDVQSVS